MSTRPSVKPHKRFRQMRGIGLLKVFLLIPLALVLMIFLAVAFFEGRKAYWDYKVREMCAKDGGVKVYERIKINAEDYRRLNGAQGEIPIPERRSATTRAEYVSDTEITWIQRNSLEVYRTEATIRAVPGGRTLARYVNYARVGGDFPTFAHHSTFSCDQGYGSISKQIFIIEGVEK